MAGVYPPDQPRQSLSQTTKSPQVLLRMFTPSFPTILMFLQAADYSLTTPRPPPEAENRLRQHRERKEQEMRAVQHSKAGKRYAPPPKDYSQLWLKEFELDG